MSIARDQERLARRAHLHPNTPFGNLFRYISDRAWLEDAARRVLDERANANGLASPADLARALSAELQAGDYAPQPVRRHERLKPDGTNRAVGIAAVRDAVVQESIRMALEPILESHFLACSSGFRPRRRAMDAIHRMTLLTNNRVKMWWAIPGTIVDAHERIPHRKLQGVLKRHYVSDARVLALIRKLLNAGVVTTGKPAQPNRGVITAGRLGALLLNAYLHEIDRSWLARYGSLTAGQKTYRRTKGLGNVQYLRHGEDFVWLTNGDKAFARELHEDVNALIRELGLEPSTQLVHLGDGFDFLGFHLERTYSSEANKHITLVTPSAFSVQWLKDELRRRTGRDTVDLSPGIVIRQVNLLLHTWGRYYRHANVSQAFNDLSRFANERIYRWLLRKHSNVSARGSVAKYVIQKYRRQLQPKGSGKRIQTWVAEGQAYRPMYLVGRRRYYIKDPGNPYLAPDELGVPAPHEASPFVCLDWSGRTPQSRYATARAARLEEVGHRCERCGAMEDLHAHHCLPQSEGGGHGKGNLVILCRACHQAEHRD